jgi:predicted GH43/DUF377 family glycosyl hydrolase
MLLKISSGTIPAGVTKIAASLSRVGFDTLKASINVATDTATTFNFPTVPAGTWLLKIDALSIDNVVIYTGSASVDILPGTTTQATITMNQIVSSGGLKIGITWGSTAVWTDFQANPVLKYSQATETGGLLQPSVIYENGTYKMWFSAMNSGGVCSVYYATSTDGLSWTRYPNPVLSPGTGASWDAGSAGVGAVIKVDSMYRMYYNGWATSSGTWSVGLATSTDGINWTKYSQPVFTGTVSGTEYRVGANDVVRFNNKYYMYYSLPMASVYNTYLAISNDGVTWTRYAGNPIVTATSSWEGSSVAFASVCQDGNMLKMVYLNSSSSALGSATSTDGINWTKTSPNPFFSVSQVANKWTTMFTAPCLRLCGNEWRIYYSGTPTSAYSIGVIRKI